MDRIYIVLSIFWFPCLFCSGNVILNVGGFYIQSANVIPMVDMANDAIKNNSNILPGYELNISWKDTKCKMGYGVKALFDQIMEPPHKTILLGGYCSAANLMIAELAPIFNLVQVGYRTRSSLLSDKSKYPTFARVNPSSSEINQVRLELIKYFKWKRVAILSHNNDYQISKGQEMKKILNKEKIDVLMETFDRDSSVQLKLLRKADMRIIIGFFHQEAGVQLFCEAHKLGMNSPPYTWFAYKNINDWNMYLNSTTCTSQQLKNVLGNYLWMTDNLNIDSNDLLTISGKSARKTWEEYHSRVETTGIGTTSASAGLAHDALWAIALSLNASIQELTKRKDNLKLEDEDEKNRQVLQKIIYNNLLNVSFRGLTGEIAFSSNGDTKSSLLIGQFQDTTHVPVAVSHGHIFHFNNFTFAWPGGKQPQDRTSVLMKELKITMSVLISCFTLLSAGIILSVAFLIFNILKRNHIFIKMSSPRLNNLVLVGSILVYLSGLVVGLPTFVDNRDLVLYAMCKGPIWFGSIGFTLSFGAMFAKTWRVYVIFRDKLERRVISDLKLFVIVGVLLSVDLIILGSWAGANPMHLHVINIGDKIETDDGNNFEQIFILGCDSDNYSLWIVLICLYKGGLLMFGSYLAWSTRKLIAPALNDSKYIGISIYNVCLVSAIGVPVVKLFNKKPDHYIAVTTFLIMYCSLLTLGLMFVPKILQIKLDPEGKNRPRFLTTLHNSVNQIKPVDHSSSRPPALKSSGLPSCHSS